MINKSEGEKNNTWDIKSIFFNLLRLLLSFLYVLIFFFVLNIILRFFISIINFAFILCLFILCFIIFTFDIWLLLLFIIITILLWNVHKLLCLGAFLQLRWRTRRGWWLELCIFHICKIFIQEILSILTTSFISNINR